MAEAIFKEFSLLFFGITRKFAIHHKVGMKNKNQAYNESYIEKDRKTKVTRFHSSTAGHWKLFSGFSQDKLDLNKPILQGKGRGVFTLKVSKFVRSYFLLQAEHEHVMAEKRLPMEGCYNLRDLGGIRTKDGRMVAWGQLFRSDDLSNLTDVDIRYLGSIPIRTVIDFRAASEYKHSPDRLPISVNRIYPLFIQPGQISRERIQTYLSENNMDAAMVDMNKLFVTDPICIKRYTEFFKIIQERRNLPILFHCSAGKDRTGLAAALVLYALGVDEKTIMHDYLLSAEYIKDKYSIIDNKYPRIKPLFTVEAKYLQASFNLLKRRYGSIDNFLEFVLKADANKLRSIYLTNP